VTYKDKKFSTGKGYTFLERDFEKVNGEIKKLMLIA
jgi:hypothetical protein